MARDLRLSHRELHVREEAAGAALTDVPLRFLVRPGRRGADDVEPKLFGQPLQFDCPHNAIVPLGHHLLVQ